MSPPLQISQTFPFFCHVLLASVANIIKTEAVILFCQRLKVLDHNQHISLSLQLFVLLKTSLRTHITLFANKNISPSPSSVCLCPKYSILLLDFALNSKRKPYVSLCCKLRILKLQRRPRATNDFYHLKVLGVRHMSICLLGTKMKAEIVLLNCLSSTKRYRHVSPLLNTKSLEFTSINIQDFFHILQQLLVSISAA